MNCGGIYEIYRSTRLEHIADGQPAGMCPAFSAVTFSPEEHMLRSARLIVSSTLVAAAFVCAPHSANAQNTDSTNTTYATTETHRGFDWGWLGLLGLLGLLPRKRRDTVTETRTTTGSGTGAGTGGRY
jgi:hypothetical protein